MTGNQEPRIEIAPIRTGTDGIAAERLMKAYGITLDPWQRRILDTILGVDNAGNYSAVSAGMSVPRQNGKNVILEAREFYGLLINGERILHTAHQLRTAKKSFRRLEAMFTDKRFPEIVQEVKIIRHAIGEESIELKNGALIEFTSRSRQVARGFAGLSLIIHDEAQELTDEQNEAIMATLAASATGTRQIIYAGTPPYIGCPGEVFRRFRDNCILADQAGNNNSQCWYEWGVDAETPQEIDISDRRLWYQANPSLGIRLTEEFTAEEFKTLSTGGFLRERLGYWARPITEKAIMAINPEAWGSCKSTEEKPEGKTAFAVKFTPDGSEVALAGAVIPDHGPARITLIAREQTGNGLQWLANWLNERYKTACCVVIDGRNGPDVLIEKMKDTWKFKDSIRRPKTADIIAAASMLLNEIAENTVTWYAEQEELNDSAITATKRQIAGGFGFGGPDSAPIEAASLALWGCRTSKRNPGKVMRIG